MAGGGASGLLARPDQAAARAGGHGPGRRVPPQSSRSGPTTTRRCPSRRKPCARPRPACKMPRSGCVMVRKWQPAFRHAVLEYHASVQRIKDMAAGDVPSGVNLLTRIIDALEAYLRVAPPSGLGAGRRIGTAGQVAARRCNSSRSRRPFFDESAAAEAAEAAARARGRGPGRGRPGRGARRGRRDPAARMHDRSESTNHRRIPMT